MAFLAVGIDAVAFVVLDERTVRQRAAGIDVE